MAAFEVAIAHDYLEIKTDARLTKDSMLVIIADEILDRTTSVCE